MGGMSRLHSMSVAATFLHKLRGCTRPQVVSGLPLAAAGQINMQKNKVIFPLRTSPYEPKSIVSPLANPAYGLAWSNPNISTEALISKALVSRAFYLILAAVVAHGLEKVAKTLEDLVAGGFIEEKELEHARESLTNIAKGAEFARTQRDQQHSAS